MGRQQRPPQLRKRNKVDMDVLSSATWKSTIEGEIKARKAWKAKYGHQFEMEDSTAGSAPPSRPQTGASQASRCSNASRAQSRVSSRAAESPDQRKKLIELKAKLTAALEEVESELGETQRLK